MLLDAFFDELSKIAAAKQAAVIPEGAVKATAKWKKLLPWLGAAALGGGATMGAQDVAKTYQIGKQVRESQGI